MAVSEEGKKWLVEASRAGAFSTSERTQILMLCDKAQRDNYGRLAVDVASILAVFGDTE